jgi:hypothetical protein
MPMKNFVLAGMILPVAFIFGCAKPDKVETFKSPTEGVYYTVETYDGIGLASGTTSVYAHFERNGKAKKLLVLQGDDLTLARLTWNSPHDVTLCLRSGFTETFRNDVTLILGDTPEYSMRIYNHLEENCDTR